MTAPVVTLREVLAVLDAAYPHELAEPWDAVGLVAGELGAPVRRVLLAVDVTDATVTEALDDHADLLIAHHPLFLRPVHGVGTDTWKGALVHRLVRGGCALVTVHTNADAAAPGVSDALARVLGLTDLRPLRPATADRPEALTVEAADVAPRHGGTGLGRVGRLADAVPLGRFADAVARALPATAAGIRVAGPVHAGVQVVAVCGGAGDDLLADARRAGADVYVTSDLRHHVVSESLADGPPWLVDVPHWAGEWPWLAGARERLLAGLQARGRSVAATLSTVATDPWSMRL